MVEPVKTVAAPNTDTVKRDMAPELPHVASNVIAFKEFATRGKPKTKAAESKTKRKIATRGKPKVEAVKASAGTWAFRLRWNSLPGRPVAYISRVSDSVYNSIRKGNYAAFKEQLISSYGESALRASNQA